MRLPGHHLAEWLAARGRRVAYVSAPVSPWHFLSGARRAEARRRWSLEGARGRWRTPRIYTMIPRTMLPVHRSPMLDTDFAWRWSERLTIPRASRVLAAEGFAGAEVLTMHNLQLAGLLDALPHRRFVLRLEDDIAGFPEMPRAIVRNEAELIARADIVTVTAARLRAKAHAAGARRVVDVPNGVDTARFRRPESLPPRPADLPPGPVAIYVGALDSWFDEELLAEVASRLKGWNFALIGPPRREFAKLRALSNVHFLGPRAPSLVPAYLWHSQAGLIPFRRIPLIESVSPLKLFEYLAAGLPVVATRWEEIERLASPARLAAEAREFADSLEESLVSPADGVAWAGAYDWDAIFQRLDAAVENIAESSPSGA